LGREETPYFTSKLVKKQLAYQANSNSGYSELGGEFNFSIVPMPGKTLVQMDSLFRNALDSFEARGVTEEDVAKFKGSTEAQQINSLQSVAGKVSQLAAFQTFAGNPNKIADLIKMYTSVTREDVMRVYNKYIKGKYAVVLSVVPKGQEKMIVAADNFTVDTLGYKPPDYGYAGLKYAKAKDGFDRSKIPGSGPNPVVKVPAFWKKEQPNGIKMIGTETSEIPTVTLTVTLPGGHLLTATDTAKVGLADFFCRYDE
jgi:zinc protease